MMVERRSEVQESLFLLLFFRGLSSFVLWALLFLFYFFVSPLSLDLLVFILQTQNSFKFL